MIFTAFDRVDAYRMHSPKWAFAPTSGEGAAEEGGRVNRPGLPASYLALDPNTVVLEYQQEDPLVPPGTLVSYRVTVDRIADFRAGYSSEHWAGSVARLFLRLAGNRLEHTEAKLHALGVAAYSAVAHVQCGHDWRIHLWHILCVAKYTAKAHNLLLDQLPRIEIIYGNERKSRAPELGTVAGSK